MKLLTIFISVIVVVFFKFSAAYADNLGIKTTNFKIQGVWVAFATKKEAINQKCSNGTTTFKFDENKIYMLPKNGELKILAETHSYQINKNEILIKINNPSANHKSKMYAKIIDKNHFYITQVFDFNNESQKFIQTVNRNLFLKKCDA